jgi:hypothetical protein
MESTSSATVASSQSNSLDIVNLIEKSPLTRFNQNYQSKFIQKIQQKFTESQQHMFVGSFYCYLNYNKNDFVIDMDNVWKWLDFSRKDFCKKVLDKHFIENVDFIVKKAAPPIGGAAKNEKNIASPIGEAKVNDKKCGSGLNKETILLNVKTFKKLCLKSNTKKANEIHDYFIIPLKN